MGADRNLAEDTASIAEFLAEEIGRSIKKPIASSQYDDAFSSFELDSLQAVGLIGEAETHLGIEISPTMVYDHPTINKLASALASMVNATLGADDPQPLKTQPSTPADDPSTHGDAPVARVAETKPASAIAIIGMEVRVPGRAGVADFWTSLKEGQSHNVNIDPALFCYVRCRSRNKRPATSISLEATEQAFRDAGINPDNLKGRRVGVFIGISAQDFAFVSVRQPNAFSGLGSASSIAANRLSYFYDLRGPSVAVDTACSSSLVALDLAKKSLQDGGCELAVVGGVNLAATGHLHHALVKAGMLAQDGRCKTFDAGADGYGRGEGCVVLVLKPEDAARDDGDRIYARIAGCAVNQDGRSNGITAPNGPSQVHVIKDAIRDAGISIDE
ncbi:uncharacterized protein LOC114828545, partial [Galendromus occidentalis]|uniref:Uncharacterized protein LOC114828545 n=1 Tax=Galendromus occidentalis TaxID=34638 RepID=A0AAJ7WJ90_9ACAR